MKNLISASLSGLLFGFGLSMSAMLDRHRILDFLDITGNWDPTLLFVMSGAVLVTLISFRIIFKNKKPVLGDKFYLPLKKNVDVRLTAGAVLFGAGWGLTGYCPGPGFTAITLGSVNAVIFCAGYIVGSLLSKYYLSRLPDNG